MKSTGKLFLRLEFILLTCHYYVMLILASRV